MSQSDELEQIAALVDAKYEQQQLRFAKLVARENQLRAEIARLDDMRRATNAPDAKVDEMRAIGADVIWYGWVGRSKAALNIQLAQVLAQKEHHQTAVRLAYGKVLVVAEMRDAARLAEHARNTKGQLDRAIAQSLLHQ